jgi:hypothetical protein
MKNKKELYAIAAVLAIIVIAAVALVILQHEQKCGLEQCHGLELTCGPNVPEMCTKEYKLGISKMSL